MLDEYMNQDIDNPKYLFHGSPSRLSELVPHESKDARGNKTNIANAVFLFPSFLKATPYAFMATIIKNNENSDWHFSIPNTNTSPLMTMLNVNVFDDIVGYIHVVKKDEDMIKDEGSYQYKCYKRIVPIDIIPVRYHDYANLYESHTFRRCVPTLEEVEAKWDYEISIHDEDKDNWLSWKESAIRNYKEGRSIPYYGILDGNIIVEATALIDKNEVQNSDGLVDDKTAYLTAFRTNSEYEGQGYFRKVFEYMINNLKRRGFKKVTLGVEPTEERNKEIYEHLGFNEFIKSDIEEYPDGTKIDVDYYGKHL